MISSLESGYGIEELSADRTNPADAPTPAVAKKDDGKFHFFGKDGLQFSDLLAAVNPLQQLPIIGTLYREITGDVITPAARLVGGAIYGGPIGAVASALDDAFEYVTGSDMGKTVVALVTHGEFPHAPGEDTGETMLADASKDAGTIENIPPAPAAAAAPVVTVASAALEGSAAPSFAMADLPKPSVAEVPTQVAALPTPASIPVAAPAIAPVSTLGTPAIAATQVAEFPHARLVNRTGTAQAAPGQTVASAAQPQLAATAMLSAPAPRAAPAQLAEAPAAPVNTQPAATQMVANQPAAAPQLAMTIGAAAAADEAKTQRQPGGPGLGGIGMGSYGMRPSASGLAAQTMQGMPIASMGGDQSNAANALAQISATGMTRSGLPTAGAATPASVMVDARNASAPGANPAAAFSGGMGASPAAAYAAGAAPSTSLLPPRRINVSPRMPIQSFQQAPNHTAVDLPGQSSVSAAKSATPQTPAPMPLQEPMAAAPAAAVDTTTASAVSTPSQGVVPATAAAIPDAMARALDKYDTLVKGKRGDGVDRSY